MALLPNCRVMPLLLVQKYLQENSKGLLRPGMRERNAQPEPPTRGLPHIEPQGVTPLPGVWSRESPETCRMVLCLLWGDACVVVSPPPDSEGAR